MMTFIAVVNNVPFQCAGDDDSGKILYLTDLDDRLGLETSTVGCAMAEAFQAFEKGLLTTKHTDGLGAEIFNFSKPPRE